MKKKILIVCTFLLLLSGCKDVKLQNGENAIVSFSNNEGISADELFKKLKETYGANTIVEMVDTMLLNKEFEDDADLTTYINDVVKYVKSSAESNETTFEEYIASYYGKSTLAEFKDYVALNYKRNLWLESYAKTLVTDKQIEQYYKKYTIGDITASHILISPEVKSDATTEEKTAAEKEALKLAKEIIAKLDKGEDFATLAKKYSDDESNASKGGVLDPFNRGEMEEAFENAAVELKVGKYSTTPVKTSYGYHIILKTAQADKPTLEDSKDAIIKTISSELIENDSTLYAKSLVALRDKYEMKITDTDLEKSYNSLLNNKGN